MSPRSAPHSQRFSTTLQEAKAKGYFNCHVRIEVEEYDSVSTCQKQKVMNATQYDQVIQGREIHPIITNYYFWYFYLCNTHGAV